MPLDFDPEEDLSPEEEEQLRVELINRIAEGIFLGRITDDNMSPSNGQTSLEQIIGYEFNYEGEEELKKIKDDIYARVLDLSGGCDMFGSEEEFEF